MAVTETVKIVFEADTKAITDTTKELTSMKKATEEDVAAFKKLSEETKTLNNNLSATDDNFVSLRTQVKQAKDEVVKLSAEFGEFSAEANAARVKAGALADQMSDLNRQVNLLNPEAKAKAFVNFGNQVVGAFQIATGALQAFGSENAEVQKIAMKLQGALNVAQGIASLKGLKESYQDIKVVLGVTTAAQVTMNGATAAGTAATGGFTAALKALRVALVSNPFTAVAVAIGSLIGAYMLLTDNTIEAVDATKKLKEAQDGLKKTSDSLTKSELDLAVATGKISKARADIILQRQDESAAVKPLIEDQRKLNAEIEKETKALQALREFGLTEDSFGDTRVKDSIENLNKLKAAEQTIQQQIDDIRREGRNRRKIIAIEESKDQTKAVDNVKLKEQELSKLKRDNAEIELMDKNKLIEQTKKLGKELEALIPIQTNVAGSATEMNKAMFAEDEARAQAVRDLYAGTYDFILSLSESYYQREQQELESQREKGIITEEQYQEKLKKIKQNQARQDKELAIFAATVSLAEAIVKALTIKPPASFAAAAATAAIAGLNLAKIIATPLPKFKQGTLSVPGIDTGQDTVMAMLRPGEAVIPTETNREYAPALRAIYRRDINAKELNDFVTNRDQGAFAFNQVSLDALYRRDMKVSAITASGNSAQINVKPTKITADIDVQQLSRAMSKNKAVEVTNTAALGEAIAAQLSKRINPRQVI